MSDHDDPGSPTLTPNFGEERRHLQPYRCDELLALPEREPLIEQLLHQGGGESEQAGLLELAERAS